MKWIQSTVLALGILCVAQELAHATPFGVDDSGLPTFTCGYSQINGNFQAKVANYSMSGGCLQNPSELLVTWSATGAHHEGIGFTEETIYLNGPSPYRGQIHFTMICAGLRSEEDPWVTKVICGSFKIEVQGEIAGQKLLLDAIYQRVKSRGGPLTASFSYDRKPLLAKRQTELQAEVAKAEAEKAKAEAEKRRADQLLQGAKQPSGGYSTLLHPTVLAPTGGQIFAQRTAVPIKLAPPKGWNVTSYLVVIERKDAKGNWIAHTTIPVGAADAHSAAGYKGFGGGAPPAFLILPGQWRMSALASYPNKSGSSDWVEFVARDVYQEIIPNKNKKTINPFIFK